VLGSIIVPMMSAVEFEVEFDGDVGAQDVEDAGLASDPRPFCIACPMNPPTSPASKAIKIPIIARIHHRFHPLRDPPGCVSDGSMGGAWSYPFDGGNAYAGVLLGTG
jgi:hypothetical protein